MYNLSVYFTKVNLCSYLLHHLTSLSLHLCNYIFPINLGIYFPARNINTRSPQKTYIVIKYHLVKKPILFYQKSNKL